MPETDDFGVVILDEKEARTFQAWALKVMGKISPEYVFLENSAAKTWATLHLEIGTPIVPVEVTGAVIREI